jgi:acyl-CoA dehydrogenase
MSEIIGRCMMSMTIFGVQAPDSGNMELLAHGATDAQKERWLWPNLRGEISSAFALTEPFLAGADPTVIATTATKDGDEWVINGHKWFITNASVADNILVFAETNPEGRPHRHASVFIVPAGTPGMDIVRDIGTMSHPDVGIRSPGQPCRDPVPRLPCARRSPHRPARRRVRVAQQRLGAGGSTMPCAGWAKRSAPSTSCASGPCLEPRTASSWPSTRWCRTTWPCPIWKFSRRGS